VREPETSRRTGAKGAGAAPTVKAKRAAPEPTVSAVVETPVPAPLAPLVPPPPPAAPSAPTAAEVPRPAPRPAADAPQAEADKSNRIDFDRLAYNVARMMEAGGKIAAAVIAPRPQKPNGDVLADQLRGMAESLGKVADYYLAEPSRTLDAQTALSQQFVELWAHTMRRLAGEPSPDLVQPDPADKRFSDPGWRENPIFDFLKEAYLLTSRWSEGLVAKAEGLDPDLRRKAQFSLKQLTSALSPSNFLATNPELLRTTLAENGENLVRGLNMMAEDIDRGGGALRIRQTDSSRLQLGVDMAATPGKVVFKNELMELLQYAPTTDEVYRRPLLIVPPWINKFYVLDLNPEKSFIRWMVAQGHTVFVISWVNPDARHADKGFEAYMREGPLAALDAIERATGERDVASVGYCVGGTLLAITLAYMAAVADTRIANATLLTTQVDFEDSGDLKTFVDKLRLETLEKSMGETGYLEGAQMATAFNLLRPTELIWNYFVNDYLKGKDPAPFDLLAWNADSTRMPAANHAFYLRHCYLQNDLTAGRMEIGGEKLDLGKVRVPIYDLATREDHIAPARSVFTGAKFFGGPVRYVLTGSGHIAGVVNPASKPKYQYWVGGAPIGDFAQWLASAKEVPGSWWPDWAQWVSRQAPEKVKARVPGDGGLKVLGEAPGEYVRVKS